MLRNRNKTGYPDTVTKKEIELISEGCVREKKGISK